jgi:acetolactate synthase-1/3 small subunit
MQDRPAVLHRVVSLFRRRGYNIDSLAVGQSEAPGVSRMSLVVDADDVEQVIKQLYRLIEVLKVTDVTGERTVERETALVKVGALAGTRHDVVATASACGAKILDVASSSIVIEITGDPEEVERFIEAVRPFGLKEMMRTGRIAMTRGASHAPSRASRENAPAVAATARLLPSSLAPDT